METTTKKEPLSVSLSLMWTVWLSHTLETMLKVISDPLPFLNLLMSNSILVGKQWLFVCMEDETSTRFPSCSLSSLALIPHGCCLKWVQGNESGLIVLFSGTLREPSISAGDRNNYVRVSLKVADAAWLQPSHDLGPCRQKHGNESDPSFGRKGA